MSKVYSYDAECREICSKNPNMMIPWWLMAAYAYEVKSAPIISDACFDELAVKLRDQWKTIKHPHKLLLDPKILKSSIALKRGVWPTRCISAANRLIAGDAKFSDKAETWFDRNGQGRFL